MIARIFWRVVGCGAIAMGLFAWTSPITSVGGPPIRLASGTGMVPAEGIATPEWSATTGLIPTHWESRPHLIPTEIQAEVGLLYTTPPAAVAPANQQATVFLNQQLNVLTGVAPSVASIPSVTPGYAAYSGAVAAPGSVWVTRRSEIAKVPSSASRRRHMAKTVPEKGNPQQK